MKWSVMMLALIAVLFLPCPASADVTVLMEEPYGQFGRYNPTGHAAVYLNTLCAETPTKLRPCMPDEDGVVISRYHRVAGFDWLAIAPVPYFYAVPNRHEIPATADKGLRDRLRNEYRKSELERLIPDDLDSPPGQAPRGDWTQLIGASYDRSIFGYRIETSIDQDLLLMAWLNDRSNAAHFNLFTRNCADFTRGIVNFYYPHALTKNIWIDWGITTPKQDARRLVGFAKHHPNLSFDSFLVPQVPGSIPRSKRIDFVVEAIVRSKKYVVPLVFLSPEFVAAMVTDLVVEDHSHLSPRGVRHLP